MNGPEVVSQAQELIRGGKKLEARSLLTQLLKADPRNVPAWLWLVETLDTDEQRLQALQQCLRLNPEHPAAQKALTLFQARVAPKQPAPEPEVEAPQPVSPPLAEEESKPFDDEIEKVPQEDQEQVSSPFAPDASDDILGEWRALPDFESDTPLGGPASPDEDLSAPDLGMAVPEELDEAVKPTGEHQISEPDREWAPLKEEPLPVVERVAVRPGVVPARPAPIVAEAPKAKSRLKLPGWMIAIIVIVDIALLSIMIWLIVTYVK